jgi:hypothetical protein
MHPLEVPLELRCLKPSHEEICKLFSYCISSNYKQKMLQKENLLLLAVPVPQNKAPGEGV